jgi:hypothetical protein
VKRWGRYIAPIDLTYGNYNENQHIFLIYFKNYKKEDLPNGRNMGKREFGDANVNMVVAQMDIKCGC